MLAASSELHWVVEWAVWMAAQRAHSSAGGMAAWKEHDWADAWVIRWGYAKAVRMERKMDQRACW